MSNFEKINYYSNLLSEGEDLLKELEQVIRKFYAYEDKYKILSNYYKSQEIIDDLKLENDNKIPKEINVGVLAEDYTYDLLCDYEKYLKVFNKIR